MFYSGKISINKPLKISSKDLKVFSIQSIILDKTSNSNKKINVYININDNKEKFKICSLQKENNEIYNCSLILSTKKNQEYTFKIDGDDKNIINICGFVDYEESNNIEKENEKINKKEKKSEKKNNKKEKNEIKEDNKKNNDKEKKENDDNNKEEIENKNEYGDLRDAPDIEEDSLDDNSELEIEKLLNKKRKEAPQDIKPIVLKNLKDIKKENINDKNKNKNQNQNKQNLFKGNKNKNKEFKKK